MDFSRTIIGCYAAIALCLTASLAACSTPDANANGRLAVHEVFSDCSAVEGVPDFEGRSLANLERELGESDLETRFTLHGGLVEFRVELLNLYPLPANANREIIEQTWESGGCMLTVWSTENDDEIVSVDSLRYSDSVEF